MTRKDYVALAEALAEAQNHATDGNYLAGWYRCVHNIADVLGKDNPRFDRPLDVIWLCRPCHDHTHHDEVST